MKKILYLIVLVILGLGPLLALAQEEDHTAREEAEGKIIWQQLQNKELTCANLTDDNFASLGEFFMGQRLGNSHQAMNQMMSQMMGEAGEEQMHIVMGKKLTGCDSTTSYPSQGIGFLPMMSMMFGNTTKGGENNMMWNFSNNPMGAWGFGFGWIFMVLFWILIIWGFIAFIRWLSESNKNNERTSKDNKALDVLKERYAKGEIDKKEFDQKKKDLTS